MQLKSFIADSSVLSRNERSVFLAVFFASLRHLVKSTEYSSVWFLSFFLFLEMSFNCVALTYIWKRSHTFLTLLKCCSKSYHCQNDNSQKQVTSQRTWTNESKNQMQGCTLLHPVITFYYRIAFCEWKLKTISISDEFLEGRNKYLLII